MKLDLAYVPNIHKVEIEITTICNLRCLFCDRRASQAESHDTMPIESIEAFVKQSIETGHRWDKIAILGGEPTLHPRIVEITKTLRNYCRDYQPGCELYLVSNAHGTLVQKMLAKLEPLIQILRRPKKLRNEYFNNVDLAPVDFVREIKSCHILEDCGLGLSVNGYYPCGASAAIARVLNINSSIQRVEQIDQAGLQKELARFCQLCGHALAIPVRENDQPSNFWAEAYAVYKARADGKQLSRIVVNLPQDANVTVIE